MCIIRGEVTVILNDKRILYGGGSAWADPNEQHDMLERLSISNVVIWANPFGKLGGALLPRITTLKEGLTIYNPGVNYLPVAWLSGLNERRRLLQVNLYLIERDFEPDLVWIDDKRAVLFAAYHGKKGALTLYYAHEDLDKTTSREERRQVANAVDVVLTPYSALYKKYREHTRQVFLLGGGNLFFAAEDCAGLMSEDEETSDDMLEKAYMDSLQQCLEEISSILEKEMAKKKRNW